MAVRPTGSRIPLSNGSGLLLPSEVGLSSLNSWPPRPSLPSSSSPSASAWRGERLCVSFFTSALAAWALLISEQWIKPLVQRTYYGELTFPPGNVTAVHATALAMWLALGPVLGRQPRYATLRPWRGVGPPYVAGSGRGALAHPTRRHRVRVAVRWHRHCRCCRLRTRCDFITLRGYGARSFWGATDESLSDGAPSSSPRRRRLGWDRSGSRSTNPKRSRGPGRPCRQRTTTRVSAP